MKVLAFLSSFVLISSMVWKISQSLTCPNYKTTKPVQSTKTSRNTVDPASTNGTPVTNKSGTKFSSTITSPTTATTRTSTTSTTPTKATTTTTISSTIKTSKPISTTTKTPTSSATTATTKKQTTATTTATLTTTATSTPTTATSKPTTKHIIKSSTAVSTLKSTTKQTTTPSTKTTSIPTPTSTSTIKPTTTLTTSTTKATTIKSSPKQTTIPTTKPTTTPSTKATTTKTTKQTSTSISKATTKPTTTLSTTKSTITTATTIKSSPKQTTIPTSKPTTTPSTKATTTKTTKQTTTSTSKATTKPTTTLSTTKSTITTATTIKSSPKQTTIPTSKPTTTPSTKATTTKTTKQTTTSTSKATTKPTTTLSTTKSTITTATTIKSAPKQTTIPTSKPTTTPSTKATTTKTTKQTTTSTSKATTKPTTTLSTTKSTITTATTIKSAPKQTTIPTSKPTTTPSTKATTTKTTKQTTTSTSKATTKPTTTLSTTKSTITTATTIKSSPKQTTIPTSKPTTTPSTKATTTKTTKQTTTSTSKATTKPTTTLSTTKSSPTTATTPAAKHTSAQTTSKATTPISKPTNRSQAQIRMNRAPILRRAIGHPIRKPNYTTTPTGVKRSGESKPGSTMTTTTREVMGTTKPSRKIEPQIKHTAGVKDSVHDPSPDFTPYNDSTTFDEDIPDEDSPTVGATAKPFPGASDQYQVEVEANIIDKGYTVDAKIYYDYLGNRAALTLAHKTNFEDRRKFIYNYATDEIFTVSAGFETVCTVQKLITSKGIHATWVFGFTSAGNGLHIAYPNWQISFQDETDNSAVYLGNSSIRGIPVDHWQGCGRLEANSTMLIDYYFASSWNPAWNYLKVPIRMEIIGDKQLANGSIYSIHHIYDFFNYQPFLDNDPSIFQTPKGIICPGRQNTKPAPVLPQNFYYRVEIIYEPDEVISYEDIWYDSYSGHYRKDYRPLFPQYPTFSTNPLTEIHDYHIGTRYVIDKTLGNCTVLPLTNTSGEAQPRSNSGNSSSSYIITLKNPLQLFDIASNYTFIGQSAERGLMCDVYVTEGHSLMIFGFTASVKTSITVYFLAKEWLDYVNLGQDYTIQTPIKMELNAEEMGFKAVYNYLDFTADKPFLDVYDITPCFSDKNKLNFQVRFPGAYMSRTDPDLKNVAHMEFANDLGVNILRVQGIGVEYDDQYLYISATLLDNPPPPALFEYVPGKFVEKEDDLVIFNVSLPMECPGYCVNNKNFVCNSYDFCSYPVGNLYQYECRLSRAHNSEGIILSNSKTCDHFSRSVAGTSPEPNIMNAYKSLRESVYNQTVVLFLANPNPVGFPVPADPYIAVYTATDISVTFGWLTSNVKIPHYGDYFHYRVEVSIPAIRYTFEAEIWYDKTLELIREDVHYGLPVAPYYSTNPMTIIEDFSTGLQYRIDRTGENCTVEAIPVDSHAAILTDSYRHDTNSTWSLRIRNSSELLHIDNTYKFVGQQTIRGMLCNVFESRRTDFNLPTFPGSYETLWRYFFLADYGEPEENHRMGVHCPAICHMSTSGYGPEQEIYTCDTKDDWYEISEESSGASSVPVRLEVTATQFGVFMEYNFFDFDNERPDISLYGIHQCYNTSDWNTFQVTFPGPYHPFLDTHSDMFRLETIFALSRITGLPPLRFQRTRLDYDIDNIYITTTMVGQAQILSYFTHVTGGGVVDHPDALYNSYDTGSPEECARICYNTDFECNGFYYCTGDRRQCLLSQSNVPNGPDATQDAGCQSYSRTIKARDFPPPSTNVALVKLKNSVYRRKLWIEMFDEIGQGAIEPHKYTATVIRTDIIGHIAEGSAMQRFTVFNNNSKTTVFESFVESLSIGDCAIVCLDTIEFECEGYAYCDDQIDCWLLKTRPEKLPAQQIVNMDNCYIYQRTYLEEYTASPGPVSLTYGDFSYWPQHSVEDCAKACSQRQEFTCRSFEYCQRTNECLVFKGRTLGHPTSETGPSCSYYTRNYLVDFQPSNLTGNFIFTSDMLFLQVSLRQCAQICVEQQGNDCHGFYFCQVKMNCHLMFPESLAIQAFGTEGGKSQDTLCKYYDRTNLQTTLLPSTAFSSSSSQTAATVTSPTFRSTSTTKSTTTRSTTVPTLWTVDTFRPPFTHTIWWPTPSTPSTSSSQSTTIALLPTALHQTRNDSNNKSYAGTMVGVAFGTFVLGIVIGAFSFYVLNKYQTCQLATHYFYKRKRGHSTIGNKEGRAIEMDFTKLDET